MKGFLVYLFGALGLGSLLNGAAALAIPDLGGLRTITTSAIAIALWLPIHRWLTRPTGLIAAPTMTDEEAAESRTKWEQAHGRRDQTATNLAAARYARAGDPDSIRDDGTPRT